MEEITLPYANNARFKIEELINHFRVNNLKYIIIGSTKATLQKHPKPNSLDVWIRTHPNVLKYKDTCQSVDNVKSQIIRNKSFSLALRECPKSKRICKALVFCNNNN